jgi:hypothetical protein
MDTFTKKIEIRKFSGIENYGRNVAGNKLIVYKDVHFVRTIDASCEEKKFKNIRSKIYWKLLMCNLHNI